MKDLTKEVTDLYQEVASYFDKLCINSADPTAELPHASDISLPSIEESLNHARNSYADAITPSVGSAEDAVYTSLAITRGISLRDQTRLSYYAEAIDGNRLEELYYQHTRAKALSNILGQRPSDNSYT